MTAQKKKLSLRELILFSLFGAMMYLSAQIDLIPNVHPLALFIAVLTLVYRKKALIPLYLYVFLEGIFGGFSVYWWPAYLYVWLFTWIFTMLIPKGTKEWIAAPLISVIMGLHGILFGAMYAPYSVAVLYKGDFSRLWPYIVYGFPFDVTHCIGNLVCSSAALPLVRLLCRLEQKEYPFTPGLPAFLSGTGHSRPDDRQDP